MPDLENTDRKKLIELLTESDILCNDCGENSTSYCIEGIVNLLIANGVIIVPHRNIVTHADRIRRMSIREMASFLARCSVSGVELQLNKEGRTPTAVQLTDLHHHAYAMWMRYLDMPVGGEGHEWYGQSQKAQSPVVGPEAGGIWQYDPADTDSPGGSPASVQTAHIAGSVPDAAGDRQEVNLHSGAEIFT